MLKEFKGKELSRQSKYIYLVSQGFEQEEGLAGETQAKLGKVRQENGRSVSVSFSQRPLQQAMCGWI